MLWALALIFGISCVLSLLVNWAARALALRVGLVDRPDGHRKLQSQAIPLAGGISIFAVILIIIGGLIVFDPDWRSTVFSHGRLALGLLVSGSLIVLLGVVDDWVGLRGRQKLLGQIAAASVLVAFGGSIHEVQVLEWHLELGVFAVPFTIFWLVGAINSLNLLDGIDGLAGTIGFVLSGALAVMALLTGHETIALVATVLTGSLAGFLRYNLPPATMYLGDAGSMLIGLAVGVMAIQASLKASGTVLLAVPLALWTIPIFDTAAAIFRRTLTGRSIYTTDRAHLHHRLLQRIGHRMTLVCVAAVSLLTSIAALLSVWWKFDLLAILSGGLVVLVFVSLRVFGHSELLLGLVRARSFLRSVFLPNRAKAGAGWHDAVRLQGTRQWGILWETLTEGALKLGFVQLRLDVNVPILGEGYHASWSHPNSNNHNQYWRLDMPLMANDCVMGYIRVVGDRGGIGGEQLEHLTDLLQQIETHLHWLLHPASLLSGQKTDSSVPNPATSAPIASMPIPDPSMGDTVVEIDAIVSDPQMPDAGSGTIPNAGLHEAALESN